ncbi:MAG TPA: sugar phosphate isomerase/epimerase family protein [Syntrophales bacterium]|nr:sugar phosphate isomerase/epimerase family protein [Syntrophales bacterium]
MPFHFLHDRFFPLVISEKINPEISFNHSALDRFRKDDFIRIADALLEAGLRISFHAPFMDLRPGAIDPEIRKASIARLGQVFDLVPYFRPVSVVCHASFDKRYYVSNESEWLKNSVETWTRLLDRAASMDTVIALENVYETDPEYLSRLLEMLPSQHLFFCLDTGHFNVFSTSPLDDWMNALGARLGEIHIHDNNGLLDEHLPVGEGTFPFRKLFEMINQKGLKPLITVETHSEKRLWRMLENLKTLNLVEVVS